MDTFAISQRTYAILEEGPVYRHRWHCNRRDLWRFGAYLGNPYASWGQIAAGTATGAALGGLAGLIEPGAVLSSAISAGGDLLGQAIRGGPINVNEVLIAEAAGLTSAALSSPFAGTEDEGLKVTAQIIGDTGGGALGLLLGGLSRVGGGSPSFGCSE